LSRKAEIQVGLTVLAALAILILGVIWLKDYSLHRDQQIWHVRFQQTGGLAASDEVQVNGMRKGAVSEMKLEGDHVIVDLALAKDVHLTRDSRVTIRNVGLMGEKVIAVDLKTTGGVYGKNELIPGVYELGVPEVMASMGGTVDNVNRMTEQLSRIADAMDKNGDLAGAVRNFRETSENLKLAVQENRIALRQAIGDFAAMSKTARGLTTDREAQLRRTLDNFSQAAENLNHVAVRLDSLRTSLQVITSRVEHGQGTLGKLVNDDRVYRDLNGSILSLRLLIEDIKANPKKYLKISVF
jgi:phospholipid/cholesterol/gamma-HCH transport system substrate-binding protein